MNMSSCANLFSINYIYSSPPSLSSSLSPSLTPSLSPSLSLYLSLSLSFCSLSMPLPLDSGVPKPRLHGL